MSSIIPISLDDFFQTRPGGSVNKAITNTVYGINIQQSIPKLETPKDKVGLVFMTRPQLNLSSDNIRGIRKLYKLLTTNSLSKERYVRTMLDPYLQNNPDESKRVDCPLVDPEMAFIPLITNTATAMSGWPDVALSTYTSTPGNWKEQYAQIDGVSEIYEAWDTDITIRNISGNLPLYLFYVWSIYQSYVFEGRMNPYPGYFARNIIDYMTRIYRLVLDRTGTKVTMIAATGVSFPKNAPIGTFFDYNIERPYIDQTTTFTIRMQSLGAEYLDDILIYEFNKTVGIFKPNMTDDRREDNMMKLTKEYRDYFNYRAYPRINTNTMELEWWVDKDLFERKMRRLDQAGLLSV